MMARDFDLVRASQLFADVGDLAFADLASGLDTVSLEKGDVLVRQGESVVCVYLVVSGRLRVLGHTKRAEPQLLFYADVGETICEMALLSDDPSFATVDAETDATVVALSREVFDRFSDRYPSAALHVIQSLSRRLASYRLLVALHLNNVFDTVNPDVLRDLEAELELLTLYGGEVLFNQGDSGDSLCIVINGRVRVTSIDEADGDSRTWELGPGELVGELEIVSNERRRATVIAVRDTQLARLTKAAFEQLVVKHPMWALHAVTRKLAERLKDADRGRRSGQHTVATIAVIPVDASAPLSAFSRELHHALSQLGTAAHLTSALVDQHLGRDGIAQTFERGGRNIRVVEWLARQESENRYVIYESDRRPSPWTERCVRQADHVILLADGAADPALSEIETELLASSSKRSIARQWLVLAHDSSHEPSGTGSWLDVRTVDRHYHVRLGDPRSVDRLARLLAGDAVAVTLGGGFARGLAHLGVFQAFDELGIPIDAVGATSMGAIVGGMWAMGWDHDRILQAIRTACSDHFGDLTFPFVAFKRGRHVSRAIREIFGDVQIEDLWVPYFCISANLNRSELRVHTRGSLAKAILASTRSPGVFPPIVYDGELHIDGGVINNVPVDLTKDFSNDGLTIGIDVSPPHELHPVHDYGDTVDGWRTFWKRCFAKRRVYTPSILLVMIRTLEYTGIANERARRKCADIYMRPDVLAFKRTDFHRAAEIVRAGYDCALRSLHEHSDKWQSRFAGIAASRSGVAAVAAAPVRRSLDTAQATERPSAPLTVEALRRD